MFKIAHRGASGYAPENTLLSFKKALEIGVDMIELDVFKCKTGELVVIHDMKVDRTTNGTGYIQDKTLEELKSLDTGEGESIPTLREVLDLIDFKAKVNIELKGENVAVSVCELLENYINNKRWSYDDFLVSSYDHYALKEVADLNKNIKIGALIDGNPIGLAEFAHDLGAYSVHNSLDFITQEFINDAQRRGLKVFVYVVNDREDIERVKKMGVDGIFSDYPDRL